ncbi:tetratricopeptide repeat protein [Pigmentibacter sp. JX0631]|uniref:response regulator n=1 Tax=Pigmentibacter sp. JX0631 TaxID=2976982 RepID=UPI0024690380|nr:response regulator [Pigmentibacter sp. JX0631]WGL58789.1 tetratricopeptide repeat protein [Pigmentibacter sp. JX0631]
MTLSIFKNIIVVDDDPDVLSQMEKIFQKIGKINYKGFLGAEQALKELETNATIFDIIFVDVRMPVFSGIALVQYIKTHENKKIRDCFCVPIVGSIGKEDKAIISEFYFYETLTKPVAEKDFIKRLEELEEQEKNPESDRNFQKEFNNSLLTKNYKKAEEILLPRLKKEPNSLRFLTLYAELLLRAQDLKKSEEFLNKILKIDPNHIPALNLISKVHIKNNKFDDAMKALEKAKLLSPHNVDRLLVIGELNLGNGEAEKAEENFKNVLKLNPTDDRASFGLGRALATQGRTEESKKVLANLKKGSELASFFNNKGVLLVKAGKFNEGVSLYKNAIKVLDMPDKEYLLLYNIALAYSKLGDKVKAIEHAKKSVEKAPPNYLKSKTLLEKLEKEGASPAAPAAQAKSATTAATASTTGKDTPKCLLTGDQMSFIMGGFDDGVKPAPATPAGEEEFISFGIN